MGKWVGEGGQSHMSPCRKGVDTGKLRGPGVVYPGSALGELLVS